MRNDKGDTMTVKCMVAAEDYSGIPDFYFCTVECSKESYRNGKHYDLAENMATDNGYTPKLVFDENDTGGTLIIDKFDWEKADHIVE